MKKIQFNIQPNLPKNILKIASALKDLSSGASLTFYIESPDIHTSFNEGTESLIREYEERIQNVSLWKNEPKRIMPSLWMLAHSYLNSEDAREFLNAHLVASSTIRKVNKNRILVGHSVKPDKEFKEFYAVDKEELYHVGKYGLVSEIPLENYPKEELPLVELIEKNPTTAKTLFLMDDSQLEKLVSLIPKIPFDPAWPAYKGTGFVDNPELKEVPLSFGGRDSEYGKYFGVTCMQKIPIITYSVSIGKKDNITKSYSESQNLKIMKTLKLARKNPTRENLEQLEQLLK